MSPKFKFTKLFLDFVTKYAYFLHEIIFNIFVKTFLISFFIIDLKEMFKMFSCCLHASPEALTPFGNSMADNPLINGRPLTRLHSFYIMASERSRFEMVDYKMLCVMQDQVYQQTPVHDVTNSLKQRLLDIPYMPLIYHICH